MPQITTQCSPSRLPTTVQLFKSLPRHHQPLLRRSHRNFHLHDRHYHLAIPFIVRDYHQPPKAIVVPLIIIDHLRDSLSHLSLSPDILIADRMPLIFQRYEDLLSPAALQYLDTLNHYSERIVVSLDEDYLRTTYYCPYTDEILVASTSTFESSPLGQGIRTFRLKFYCDPIL